MTDLLEEGPYCSFVPPTPGVYRFALFVAADNRISPADEVTIAVTAEASPVGVISGPAAVALAQIVRGAGTQTETGLLTTIADSFDAVAGRAELYSTFAELSEEMVRRLDAVVPVSSPSRTFLAASVFGPLSQLTIGEMAVAGLDLRQPSAAQAPLTAPQKAALRDLFRAYAQAFRSVAGPR